MNDDPGANQKRLRAALGAWMRADENARLVEHEVRKAIDAHVEPQGGASLPTVELLESAATLRSEASDALALVLALLGSDCRPR
jgi:hypothetical protein